VRDILDLLAECLAIMWVVIVGVQYALLLILPGAPDMSASYPALLAAVGIAGIMSYLRKRGSSS
jgi:glycerol uptake facilitator-like aquaporin